MDAPTLSMHERIAEAAYAFHREATGVSPGAARAVVDADTVVVTLHGALSKAEELLAQTPDGAAYVQEFHRRLFDASSGGLRAEVERITGIPVREAVARVPGPDGALQHVFVTGAVVQVFRLATPYSNGEAPAPAPPPPPAPPAPASPAGAHIVAGRP